MITRIFYLLPDDRMDDRISSAIMDATNATAYWAFLSKDPDRVLLAFEQGDTLPSMPQTDQQYYDRTFAALAKGDTLIDAIAAMQKLQWWASRRGLAMQAQVIEQAAPIKPGQTQIVQEWLLTQDVQELRDRAWSATMAIAKGA